MKQQMSFSRTAKEKKINTLKIQSPLLRPLYNTWKNRSDLNIKCSVLFSRLKQD